MHVQGFPFKDCVTIQAGGLGYSQSLMVPAMQMQRGKKGQTKMNQQVIDCRSFPKMTIPPVCHVRSLETLINETGSYISLF